MLPDRLPEDKELSDALITVAARVVATNTRPLEELVRLVRNTLGLMGPLNDIGRENVATHLMTLACITSKDYRNPRKLARAIVDAYPTDPYEYDDDDDAVD